MASEETENGSENNLTIIFHSNTSLKSVCTELLAAWIYSNGLEFTELRLSNCKNFVSLHAHTNRPKLLGI